MPLVLATYNVKNLFDPASDAERPLWGRKLEALAAMLQACDADVVGLQEVGSVDASRELASRLRDRGLGYGEPIFATPDARGIRCALLSRLPVAFAHVRTCAALPFPTFAIGDPAPFGARIPLRRGLVHAGVEVPGFGLVHVLVAHLKSPRPLGVKDANGTEVPGASALERGKERAEAVIRTVVWRLAEALFARAEIDAILGGDPAAHVALVGDLNDVPQSATLCVLRGERGRPSEAGALFDCTEGVEPHCRFSIVHEARPSQVDHILATEGLYVRLRGARFLNASLREHREGREGRETLEARPVQEGELERGPEAAPETMTVDSDHAPLVAYFDCAARRA